MTANDPCPHCGEPLYVHKWIEGGYIVEINMSCDCGYAWNWAYGRLTTQETREVLHVSKPV